MPQRISFSKTGYTTLTFTGQPEEVTIIPDSGVAVDVSEGDTYRAFDKGIDSDTFVLEWTRGDPETGRGAHPMHKVDYNRNFNPSSHVQSSGQCLLNWYWNVCNDGQETFTYTTNDGTAHPVRWVGGPPNFSCPNRSYFYGKVVLRREY